MDTPLVHFPVFFGVQRQELDYATYELAYLCLRRPQEFDTLSTDLAEVTCESCMQGLEVDGRRVRALPRSSTNQR